MAEQAEKYIAIESPFTYVCSVFEALAMTQGPSIFLSVKGFGVPQSPCERYSGWYLRGDILKIWCYELYKSVILLPTIYPRDFVFAVGNGDCNFRRLLYWRRTKNLTLKKILKYKKYIVLVSGKFVLFLMSLTLIVPVWFLRLWHNIKHRAIK